MSASSSSRSDKPMPLSENNLWTSPHELVVKSTRPLSIRILTSSSGPLSMLTSPHPLRHAPSRSSSNSNPSMLSSCPSRPMSREATISWSSSPDCRCHLWSCSHPSEPNSSSPFPDDDRSEPPATFCGPTYRTSSWWSPAVERVTALPPAVKTSNAPLGATPASMEACLIVVLGGTSTLIF